MNDFAVWLQQQKENHNFKKFMALIIERRDFRLNSSLAQGNTDFTKGEYKSLDWVVNLPDEILEQFKVADTSETST